MLRLIVLTALEEIQRTPDIWGAVGALSGITVAVSSFLYLFLRLFVRAELSRELPASEHRILTEMDNKLSDLKKETMPRELQEVRNAEIIRRLDLIEKSEKVPRKRP